MRVAEPARQRRAVSQLLARRLLVVSALLVPLLVIVALNAGDTRSVAGFVGLVLPDATKPRRSSFILVQAMTDFWLRSTFWTLIFDVTAARNWPLTVVVVASILTRALSVRRALVHQPARLVLLAFAARSATWRSLRLVHSEAVAQCVVADVLLWALRVLARLSVGSLLRTLC